MRKGRGRGKRDKGSGACGGGSSGGGASGGGGGGSGGYDEVNDMANMSVREDEDEEVRLDLAFLKALQATCRFTSTQPQHMGLFHKKIEEYM